MLSERNSSHRQREAGGSDTNNKYYQIKGMKRIDLYIKVEVELEDDDTAEKVAREICRQVEKIYVVRRAELSSAVARD
jgi:hypothetical protein